MDKVFSKVIAVLSENLKIIIMSLICIIIIMIITILLGLSVGDNIARQATIAEISGEGEVLRGSSRLAANRRMKILSGDTIRTGEDCFIRLLIEDDKYIVIEENSIVQIFYTEVEGKGLIEANVTGGSILTSFTNSLSPHLRNSKNSYKVKTPNAVIESADAAYRVAFDFEETYVANSGVYNDVYMTEIQNFSGPVGLQLYDINAEPSELPMLLTERTSAKMMTNVNDSRYIFLNHDTVLYNLPERTLTELMRITVDGRELAYSTDELNTAYKIVIRNNNSKLPPEEYSGDPAESIDSRPFELETGYSFVYDDKPPPDYFSDYPDQTTPPDENPIDGTASTFRTHVYTTFAGERWWEQYN